jgi:hypothetical protein
MKYEISIDDRHGIVEIRFVEQMPYSEHVKARDELLEICRARKMHKILVDAHGLVGIPATTIELFDFGVSWAELVQQTPTLLAGVLPLDAATRKWWKFGENVAVNRGVVTRSFDDIDEARAWLRGP